MVWESETGLGILFQAAERALLQLVFWPCKHMQTVFGLTSHRQEMALKHLDVFLEEILTIAKRLQEMLGRKCLAKKV